MYTITGPTGHVGAVVVEELMKRGAPVRAVVREKSRGERVARLGAETATADLGDREAFAEALRGSSDATSAPPADPRPAASISGRNVRGSGRMRRT